MRNDGHCWEKKLKHRSIYLPVLLMFTTLLISCQDILSSEFQPVPNETSVLEPPSGCDPPCWLGMTPGKTGATEAAAILKSVNVIKTDSIDESTIDLEDPPLELHKIQWWFQPSTLEKAGAATFIDDRLAWIYFNTSNSINFKQAVELYGEPQSVIITPYSHDGKWTNILLLYSEVGIALHDIETTYPENPFILKPDMPVEGVTYFDPDVYDYVARLSVPSPMVHVPYRFWYQGLQDWQGFDYAYQIMD